MDYLYRMLQDSSKHKEKREKQEKDNSLFSPYSLCFFYLFSYGFTVVSDPKLPSLAPRVPLIAFDSATPSSLRFQDKKIHQSKKILRVPINMIYNKNGQRSAAGISKSFQRS